MIVGFYGNVIIFHVLPRASAGPLSLGENNNVTHCRDDSGAMKRGGGARDSDKKGIGAALWVGVGRER